MTREFTKLTWLKRTDGHRFTGAEFRVLIALFNHSGADGGSSHPGLKLLSEETGYRKSGVSEAITSLKARGWIRELSKGSGYTGNASVFELVPDAPKPPSSSARPEQLGEVVPLERTSSSATAEQVVPLQRKPSDPDTRSGSDPFRSDQKEVRSEANHLEDHEQSFGGSALTVEDSEAAEETEGFRPEGLVAPQTSTVKGSSTDDPFSSEPTAWALEQLANEQRALEKLEPSAAVARAAAAWAD